MNANLQARDRQALREILGESGLREDPLALETYGLDRSTQWRPAPCAVALPKSVEQVQAIIRLASGRGLAVVPSGGRTGLSGGAVAASGELVLSLERMRAIGPLNQAEATVEVEAGVVTARLQEFAREQGLYYPVDFASAGSSQIGGNIATNAGGIKVIRYGMTRDWVRGLTVVTGTGECLALNRGLIKNNTGYDLRHLMIGSEGTLAVICKATMALTRAPADPLVLLLGVRDFSALLPTLAACRDAVTLSAFECMSAPGLARVRQALDLPAPMQVDAPFYALIECEDLPEQQQALLGVFERLVDQGLVLDGVISQSLGQARALWRLRESVSEALAPHRPYKNDIAVPLDRLERFVAEVEALVAARYADCTVIWYGHIGDGNLHLNILRPPAQSEMAFLQRCARTTEEISALVEAHAGSISAEHGVGLLKKPYLHYSRSAGEIALMRSLKQVFDPCGVLNPGKIFDPHGALESGS